ncbi:acyltransferase [Cellulomonas sp. C5510]|uniref:acyltransferase family protein n=1 Tax=Cellulomonas sp. C5510 TaxID=2871170 RepID=UPI001C971C57|nr:acyltransferase family protein [Cellulomonas sp. C5510]QZN84780.1 acyltransferase [Cellulomonas sp. C5510]
MQRDTTFAEEVPAPELSPSTHARSDRSNYFDALRLGLALPVMYSHAHALSGDPEPQAWSRTLGHVAVHGFVAISGCLVASSFRRSRSAGDFAVRRALRILPELVVAMIVATYAGRAFEGYLQNPAPSITNGPVWTLTWAVLAHAVLALLGIAGVLRPGALPAFVAACWVAFLTTLGTYDPFALAIAPMLLVFAGDALLSVHQELIRRGVIAVALGGGWH